MSEDDIRKYLGRQAAEPRVGTKPARVVRRRAPAQAEPPQDTYQDFSATHLFCPRCRQATPVREKLMLFLPDGDLYDYSCQVCGTSVGTRKAGQ